MPEPMKLTRHKVGDQKYEIRNEAKEPVAIVVKTGSHLDDYPWDVYPLPGWTYVNSRGGSHLGAQESMKVAIDHLSWGLRREQEAGQ